MCYKDRQAGEIEVKYSDTPAKRQARQDLWGGLNVPVVKRIASVGVPSSINISPAEVYLSGHHPSEFE